MDWMAKEEEKHSPSSSTMCRREAWSGDNDYRSRGDGASSIAGVGTGDTVVVIGSAGKLLPGGAKWRHEMVGRGIGEIGEREIAEIDLGERVWYV